MLEFPIFLALAWIMRPGKPARTFIFVLGKRAGGDDAGVWVPDGNALAAAVPRQDDVDRSGKQAEVEPE